MVFTALIFSRPPRAWIFLATSSSAVWAEASAVRQRIPSAIFRTTRMQFAPLLTQRILSTDGVPFRRAASVLVSYGIRARQVPLPPRARLSIVMPDDCELPSRPALCRLDVSWLRDDTELGGRTHHGRVRFAGKRAGERREVGQRANHAKLGHRMRIALHHEPLRLRSGLVSAELSPRDKELLIGRESVNGWRRRLALLRLLEREVGNLDPGQVADGFAQHQLAIVMNVRLDVIAVELVHHALGLSLELLQVVG